MHLVWFVELVEISIFLVFFWQKVSKKKNQIAKSHTVTAATIETWRKRKRKRHSEEKKEHTEKIQKPSKLDWCWFSVVVCRLFGLLFELISNRDFCQSVVCRINLSLFQKCDQFMRYDFKCYKSWLSLSNHHAFR